MRIAWKLNDGEPEHDELGMVAIHGVEVVEILPSHGHHASPLLDSSRTAAHTGYSGWIDPAFGSTATA